MQNLTPYSDLHDLVAALSWPDYSDALVRASREAEAFNNPHYYANATPAQVRTTGVDRLREIDLAIKGGWPPRGWIVEVVAIHLGLTRCSDSPATPEPPAEPVLDTPLGRCSGCGRATWVGMGCFNGNCFGSGTPYDEE